MKPKRIISLLVLVTAVLSMQSCGLITVEQLDIDPPAVRDDAPTETEVQPSELTPYIPQDNASARLAEAKDALSPIDGKDYGGRIVFVLTPSDADVFSDGNADEYDRLLLARETVSQDALNVKLVKRSCSSADMFERAKREKAAGEVTDDIYVIPSGELSKYVHEGLLSDLSATDGNFSEYDFVDARASALSTANGKIVALCGDASYTPDSYGAVFINKTMLSDAGISPDELYETARGGEWTWDKLLTYSAAVGGSITTPSTNETFFDLVYASVGGSYLTLSEGFPAVDYTLDDILPTYTLFTELKQAGTKTSSFSAAAEFTNGENPFLIHRLAALEKIADSTVDFGILPIPCADGSGGYITPMPRSALYFAVPNESSEKSAALDTILAVNASTRAVVCGGYADRAFSELLRDPQSADMLDIIFDSAVIEPAFTLGANYPAVAASTYSFALRNIGADDAEEFERSVADSSKAMQKALDAVRADIQNKKTK